MTASKTPTANASPAATSVSWTLFPVRRNTTPSSTSAIGAYCIRMATVRTESMAASQIVRLSSTEGRRLRVSNPIKGTAATNSVMGLCANPAISYQKAPATRAALAVVSPKCRRAKTYMPAGISSERAQNATLIPPTYHHGWPSPMTSNSFRTPATAPGTSQERAP